MTPFGTLPSLSGSWQPAAGAAEREAPRGAGAGRGERLNGWLRAAGERLRHLGGDADAGWVAQVRSAADSAATAWGGQPGDGAVALLELPACGAALRRDGLDGDAAAQALGLVAAACEVSLGLRPFDAQLIGVRALLAGRLAEMATGEGKSLTVALAAATAALAGAPVHVVVVNDYLAARDAAAFAPLYAALGLRVGCVRQPDTEDLRHAAYRCDITCVTAKELIFDYLRDGLKPAGAAPRLRGLGMAIVDEADAILLDDATLPLLLSQAVDPVTADRAHAHAERALALARTLMPGRDFRLNAAACCATLTAQGAAAVDAWPSTDGMPDGTSAAAGAIDAATADTAATITTTTTVAATSDPLWRHPAHRRHAVGVALAALHLYRRERHYVVRDGRVLIVDAATGRLAPGRAWSDGLHALIELKEGCMPSAPLSTLAQLTAPRFFARYARLCGLSGTLRDAAGELRAAYGLVVRQVPLRRPCCRHVLPHRLYASHAALWPAVAERIAALQRAGRPVLAATDTVAEAETLAAHLRACGVAAAALHAGDAAADAGAAEAAVVARAGQAGAVTVCTNLAGRGTDIALGHGVAAIGGLHVLCCQLNAARRIDRQLAGRAARQGDPGSVETWLSLDNALLDAALQRAGTAGRLLRRALARLGPRLPDRAVQLLARWPQRGAEAASCEQRQRLASHDRRRRSRLGFGAVAE